MSEKPLSNPQSPGSGGWVSPVEWVGGDIDCEHELDPPTFASVCHLCGAEMVARVPDELRPHRSPLSPQEIRRFRELSRREDIFS